VVRDDNNVAGTSSSLRSAFDFRGDENVLATAKRLQKRHFFGVRSVLGGHLCDSPRLYRYANRTVNTLVFTYVLLLFFPNPLFTHVARVGQFRIYSDRPISSQIDAIVEQATARLATSPFYDPTDTFDVFIASDYWRRTLLIPRARGAYGASLIFTGNNIVLNRCDIENNTCFNDQPDFNRRTMHTVIAHECMHHLLADDLGILAYIRLPEWKNEGYCEYVAGDPSFDEAHGQELLRGGRSHGSHAFRYLTYLFATRSCIDDRGMTPRQFLSEPLDFDSSLEAAR